MGRVHVLAQRRDAVCRCEGVGPTSRHAAQECPKSCTGAQRLRQSRVTSRLQQGQQQCWPCGLEAPRLGAAQGSRLLRRLPHHSRHRYHGLYGFCIEPDARTRLAAPHMLLPWQMLTARLGWTSSELRSHEHVAMLRRIYHPCVWRYYHTTFLTIRDTSRRSSALWATPWG
jgi:hypothetical protein